MTNKITGIILAGGKSSRMGVDKAFISFQGKRLIEYGIDLLQRICDEVIISADNPRYKAFGLRVIADNHSNIGPLGGLEASLANSKTKHNLIIPSDTPFVNLSVYYKILRNLKNELSVVPCISGDKPEPLTAYYSKEILPIIQQQIKNQAYRMIDLISRADAKFVNFTHCEPFKNMNTIADLKKESFILKENHPNMILIAGNNRDVGKTYLACKLIKYLSECNDVIGIKISPHFHEQETEQYTICKSEKFVIFDEKVKSSKDSSLMLQAGAKRVFFIMAKQEHLEEAISNIRDQFADHLVVCESGGLSEIVQPGLFLFVKNSVEQIRKKDLLKHTPIIVNNHKNVFDFDERCIGYENNQITLNTSCYL